MIDRDSLGITGRAGNVLRIGRQVVVRIYRARYGRAVLSVDDGRGRRNLIECPRPGCSMLSGVVAATWERRRPDMSYGSVVLHGGDHGAATVVLPVPRLRSIYTASEATGAEIYRWHSPFHLLCYTHSENYRVPEHATMDATRYPDSLWSCAANVARFLIGAIFNPRLKWNYEFTIIVTLCISKIIKVKII